MKYFVNLFTYLILMIFTQAQKITKTDNELVKPCIDTSLFAVWPSIEPSSGAISENGKYVYYLIKNQPLNDQSLILQSTSSDWKTEIAGASKPIFCANSSIVVFKKGDSIGIATLGTASIKYFPGVKTYDLENNGHGKWLLFQFQNAPSELNVQNLLTQEQFRYNSVAKYWLKGDKLILQSYTNDVDKNQTLEWIDLDKGNGKLIWTGKSSKSFVFFQDSKLSFLGSNLENAKGSPAVRTAVWYYVEGMNKATALNHNQKDEGWRIEHLERFSADGDKIFVQLYSPNPQAVSRTDVKLDVWGYSDLKLQSAQQHVLRFEYVAGFNAMIDIDSKRLIQLFILKYIQQSSCSI